MLESSEEKIEENLPLDAKAKELEAAQITLNQNYAAEQKELENLRINALLAIDDPKEENCRIELDDDTVFISMGQGDRGYQQDRFDAQRVLELSMLEPQERLDLLYDTVFSFGEKHKSTYGHGSTVNVVAFTDQSIDIANLGDTRSVLLCGQQAIQLSYDHKPGFEPEKQRIEKEGGAVNHNAYVKIHPTMQDENGFFLRDRDNRGIAIARTIGNTDAYPGKSHIPSMTSFVIPENESKENESKEDALLIIASDGLWDVVSIDDLMRLKNQGLEPEALANQLRQLAYQRTRLFYPGRKAADNCTVLVSALFKNTVYAVFDGHGNSNNIVDELRDDFIKQFRRNANHFLKEKNLTPPLLPKQESTPSPQLDSQDWENVSTEPYSPLSMEPEDDFIIPVTTNKNEEEGNSDLVNNSIFNEKKRGNETQDGQTKRQKVEDPQLPNQNYTPT